jgi:peroxiredoxin
MSLSIREQSEQLQAASAARLPADVVEVFSRNSQQLHARGIPAGVVKVGDALAPFTLYNAVGKPVSLEDLVATGPAVLVFYRGVWCPYCNVALSAYQQHLLPALTERGVRLAAVSPQSPDGSLSMQEKHDLGFTVLSDPGNSIARILGILTRPSDEARAAQLELGLDLTAVNADSTVGVPMPTVAILDADHVLRWIDVHPDYSTRTEPAQVISALDQLGI